MKYNILNTIQNQHWDMLKQLMGKKLKTINGEEPGEFSFTITLETSDLYLTLKNEPSLKDDDDGYPQIVLEIDQTNIDNNISKRTVEKEIKDIVIVRNKVAWKSSSDEWEVVSDIGIKLILEEEEFLFLMIDSLAGFIKVIHSKGKIRLTQCDIVEYWEFKTEVIESFELEEITSI
ncbi:hypothetical protein [Virgibacillus sp. 6R]|uniref:hypothetical protein n=1 Tax=Metabacillus sp. 22489 TaxID=3453928 RepID=UPI0011A37BA8